MVREIKKSDKVILVMSLLREYKSAWDSVGSLFIAENVDIKDLKLARELTTKSAAEAIIKALEDKVEL